MAIVIEDVWPLPSATEKLPAASNDAVRSYQFFTGGRKVFTDLIEETYAEINEMFGTDIPTPK